MAQPPITLRCVPRTCYALVPTTIGVCGLAWSAEAILALQLPEASNGKTVVRMLRNAKDAELCAPTGVAVQAIEGVLALLHGEPSDLAALPLDLSTTTEFNRQVYAAARRIPPGQTVTYGEVADEVGGRGLSRAVGQALGQNPIAIIVPCHRVMAAGGKPGGFSAHGGLRTKRRILTLEGWLKNGQPALFEA